MSGAQNRSPAGDGDGRSRGIDLAKHEACLKDAGGAGLLEQRQGGERWPQSAMSGPKRLPEITEGV